jgi:hypothetical protein
MYATGLDPATLRPVFVEREARGKELQKALLRAVVAADAVLGADRNPAGDASEPLRADPGRVWKCRPRGRD